MKKIINFIIVFASALLFSCNNGGQTPKGEILLPCGVKKSVKIVNLPDDVPVGTEVNVYRGEYWDIDIVNYYSGNDFPGENSYGNAISYYKARIIE
jgi:hypothetical protein